MHAYLLTGNRNDNFSAEIEALAAKIGATILEFSIQKIDDVRDLNSLIRLSFSKPTLVAIKNVHLATIEALNAFLKNLEEPKANIYFVLTAPNPKKVLATIVSRCQIISLKPDKFRARGSAAPDFLNMNTGQRLAFFDKIKDRDAAISFIEELLFFLHDKRDFKNMEQLTKTLTGLKGNGNVNLQLTNLVINFR